MLRPRLGRPSRAGQECSWCRSQGRAPFQVALRGRGQQHAPEVWVPTSVGLLEPGCGGQQGG